jgi:protein CpxP
MNLSLHSYLKPLAVGTLLTVVPLVAQAPTSKPGHDRPRAERGPRHDGQRGPFAGLNLTDAQKANLKAIAEKHKASFEAQRKNTEEAMKAFHTALMDPNAKEADLRALYDKTAQVRFTGIMAHRTMMQECLAVLTPEHNAQWEKQRAEHPGFGPGFGHGFGPEGPGRGPKHGGPQHDGPCLPPAPMGPDHGPEQGF